MATTTTQRRHLQETGEKFRGFCVRAVAQSKVQRRSRCETPSSPAARCAAASPMVHLCVSGWLQTAARSVSVRASGCIVSLQPQKCPPTSCTHGCTLRSRATHTVCYHDIFSHFKATKSVLPLVSWFYRKRKQSLCQILCHNFCVVSFLCSLECICHMWTNVWELSFPPFIPLFFLFITALW